MPPVPRLAHSSLAGVTRSVAVCPAPMVPAVGLTIVQRSLVVVPRITSTAVALQPTATMLPLVSSVSAMGGTSEQDGLALGGCWRP
jgi:hypothetical protein